MTISAEQTEVLGIEWEHNWEAATHRARSERKLLLVDVEKDQ